MKFLWACVLAGAMAASAQAASVCDGGPCAVSLGFGPQGGTLATTQGATISFGPGGSFVLGDGGTLTGATVTPDGGDMSGGGSIVLAPGGSIQFGPNGGLATAAGGAVSIAEGSALDVTDAVTAAVDSDYPVQLGTVRTDGNVQVSADEVVVASGDPQPPINVAMLAGDATTQVTLTGPKVKFYAPPSQADAGSGATSGSGGCSGDSSGSVTITSGSGSTTDPYPGCPDSVSFGGLDPGAVTGAVQVQQDAGGGLPLPALLLLALAARSRRRPG